MKNYFAPILIGVILALCYIGVGALMVVLSMAIIVKVIITIVFLALGGAVIYVMLERIKEIKEEEKDDLSKY